MSFDLSDSENESADEQLKVVLLGEPSVGKTSIALRYCNNEFTKHYYPTYGVDFFLKRLVLQRSRNVTMKIWDIGGTSHTGNMIDKYIFGANIDLKTVRVEIRPGIVAWLVGNWLAAISACFAFSLIKLPGFLSKLARQREDMFFINEIIFLIYDVTNDVSFNCIPNWLRLVQGLTRVQEIQPMMVLIGNKCDLEHQRSVKIEKHKKLSSDYHLTSHVVSSRTGESVSLAFQKSAAEYLGISLTKSEIEEHQPIVCAEISTHSNVPLQPLKSTLTHSRSSVCSLQ